MEKKCEGSFARTRVCARVKPIKTDEKALGSLDQIHAIEDQWLVISCKPHRFAV